jgi:putative Ca2+/H+ antiporter (TMEM165/GDT1 family)
MYRPLNAWAGGLSVNAFWLALGIVFLAEMGDKTQLVALCLASRFRVGVVLSGILAATLVVHVVSVVLGDGIGRLLPEIWVKLAAGIIFVVFGLWTLRGDVLSDEECSAIQGRSAFWLVFTTFFVAELGDKTMLSTVALATDHPPIPVWLGSTLGMVVADSLAILVGRILGKRLPERAVRVGAASIFFAFGGYGTTKALAALPTAALPATLAVLAAALAIFCRGNLRRRETGQPQSAIPGPQDLTAGAGSGREQKIISDE